MKKYILKLASLVTFFAVSISAQAQEQIITQKELPTSAKTFLQKNFPNGKVEYVVMEKNYLSSNEYKTRLNNGVEIEFNQKGEWKEVNGFQTEIPASFIPKKIQNYVKNKFANTKIVKIEKGSFGKYEVKLSNGLELEFDSKGNFKRVEN